MRGARAAGLALLAVTLLAGAPAAAQTGGSYGDPQARAAAVESLLGDPEVARLLDADPALKRKLEQAYAKLKMASENEYDAGVAHQQGIAAAREFAEIESTLRTRREQVRAAAEAAARREQEEQLAAMRAEADALAADARRLLKEPAPHDAPTLELRGELGRALQAYERLGREGSLTALRAASERLASAGAEVEAALSGASGAYPRASGTGGSPAGRQPAPEKLLDAAAAFLAGRYAGAADILADADLGDPHATKAAYMLRGAALFAMYVESGERDAALLARVLSDVEACRRLDPAAVPSRALFSPRYAELFQQR